MSQPREYLSDSIRVTGPVPRCLQVWGIPKELIEEIGWYEDKPKDRFVLVAAVSGCVRDPAFVYLVEGTSQSTGVRRFSSPQRLSLPDPSRPRRLVHYVFADERFREFSIELLRRCLTHDERKTLPRQCWKYLRAGIAAAPENWQPVRKAWAAGGCPRPQQP